MASLRLIPPLLMLGVPTYARTQGARARARFSLPGVQAAASSARVLLVVVSFSLFLSSSLLLFHVVETKTAGLRAGRVEGSKKRRTGGRQGSRPRGERQGGAEGAERMIARGSVSE